MSLILSKKKSNLPNIKVILTFQERVWIFFSLVRFKHERNTDYPLAGCFRWPIGMQILCFHGSQHFLCLLVALVYYVARRGSKPHMNNNHHKKSDARYWCVTAVHSRMSLEARQYKLVKYIFRFQKWWIYRHKWASVHRLLQYNITAIG